MRLGHSPSCEVHAYPESGMNALVNNVHEPQTTSVYEVKDMLPETHFLYYKNPLNP
ncbi:1,3-beta-galactosyl-N-acetylhexosamine phosphorylase C-terminal domain-containing protein [Paenibacillus sp. NFR01]|uniref:1,3-beta-galactosyl-N-acetylhexosamine phosphorylase C-terminal domain-containing protein n=1 Tax=Paenibacillus sp. NFR01 TaxID=1566279 RepID=UPI00158707DF|nr:1,3-beta-galactosyl-N-acetylhexosamine phosphorylase C-terminal domain-containing protein [Paenibacillus sp. NFR01]